MTPTLVHRCSWPIRDAIEQLLGEHAGDADAWRIRIEADEVVIDIIEPAGIRSAKPEPTLEPSYQDNSSNQAPLNKSPKPSVAAPDPAPTQEKPKGGPLAQRAGIICAEKGFWRFLAETALNGTDRVHSADSAATWLRDRCGIDSRSELDHNAAAAEIFRPIEKSYRLWLDGY